MSQFEKNTKAFEDLVKVAAHGGPILPLTDVYTLVAPKPVSGEWCFCVDCPSCKRATPAFRDHSNGRLGNPFSGPGGIRLNCHYCSTKIEARADQIRTYRLE